jgi:Asp-tRNA(Asn)/Glu-tRNA(Gln) amidotransferase C subunit
MSSERVNIYLSNSEVTSLNELSEKNMTQVYIIKTNDKLRKDQSIMSQIISSRDIKISELEDDSERMEISITNLRGFVKNFGEMNKINEQLVKKYTTFQDKTRILLADKYNVILHIKWFQYGTLFVCGLLNIIIWLFNIISFGMALSSVLIYWTLMLTFMFKFHEFRQDIKNTEYFILYHRCQPSIKELEEDLKKIKKGNDFLNDLIDLQ